MSREIWSLPMRTVVAKASSALPHFADCVPGPTVNALIWCDNARTAACGVLGDDTLAKSLLTSDAFRARAMLYYRTGERGADAAATLAVLASGEANALRTDEATNFRKLCAGRITTVVL